MKKKKKQSPINQKEFSPLFECKTNKPSIPHKTQIKNRQKCVKIVHRIWHKFSNQIQKKRKTKNNLKANRIECNRNVVSININMLDKTTEKLKLEANSNHTHPLLLLSAFEIYLILINIVLIMERNIYTKQQWRNSMNFGSHSQQKSETCHSNKTCLSESNMFDGHGTS